MVESFTTDTSKYSTQQHNSYMLLRRHQSFSAPTCILKDKLQPLMQDPVPSVIVRKQEVSSCRLMP
jgi:uncharacterized protein YdaU (DUF1376 family)